MSNRKVPEPIRELTDEFVSRIAEFYGDRLDKVILFGSYARGDFHEDSDIDYMVVLNDENVNSYEEISLLSPITADLSLKYLMSVSAIPYTNRKLLTQVTPLGKNVLREGIEL